MLGNCQTFFCEKCCLFIKYEIKYLCIYIDMHFAIFFVNHIWPLKFKEKRHSK